MRDINVKLNRLLTKSKKELEGELTKIVTRYTLNNTTYREVLLVFNQSLETRITIVNYIQLLVDEEKKQMIYCFHLQHGGNEVT